MIGIYTGMAYGIGVVALVVMLAYNFFPRQTKNFFVRITKRKRFVVCHMRYANTQYEDDFLVVPESDFVTKVNKFSYYLNPKYAIGYWKKRHHFVLDESNTIPLHFKEDDNVEVIFQAMEIQNALNNDVTEYLFTKKREILILSLFAVAIIAIIAVIYSIVKMNEVIEKVNLIGEMITVQQGGT